ncbi:MAG: type II toxin-antitoxin system prevent-host-death family antitoxin [Deltaproteobacteria bacterium]|nr:type II toxin-antitoxin system prevent-host-death family antitoxin [Deltaproteobacteria bacterium]
MYYMRETTVRELQHHLSEVLRWVDHGEEVRIKKRSQVIARLIPDQPKRKVIRWPDFAKRASSLSGGVKGESLSRLILKNRE